jgi:hypothetical protein
MMKSKLWIAIQCCLILLLICFGTALIWAEEANPTSKPITIKSADSRLGTAISNAFKINVSGQNIADLRVNQKLGYGEIGLLYGLANASGKTIDDILTMRQSDMGWGEIAKSLGLKVSNIVSKNSSILKAAKMPKEDQKLQTQLKNEQKNKTDKRSSQNRRRRCRKTRTPIQIHPRIAPEMGEMEKNNESVSGVPIWFDIFLSDHLAPICMRTRIKYFLGRDLRCCK